jgi:hypothetical protein
MPDEINDLAKRLKWLENLTPADASILQSFASYPLGDASIVLPLKNLLQDNRPCLLGIPPVFSQIKWLAGRALAAEHFKLDIQEVVRVENVVRPIYSQDLFRLAEENGIYDTYRKQEFSDYWGRPLALLDHLIKLHKVTLYNRPFPPEIRRTRGDAII